MAAAISAVVRAGHAVADMSYFSARDSSPADYCQLVVAASDVYVGIVANRYGSAVRDRSEQSYVEFEFSVATDIGLPRLIFLVRDDTTSLPPAVQSDDYRVRQDAYRYRLREAGLVTASVASPSELEIKLHQSLVELSSSPWEPVVPEPRAGVPPLLTANFVGREDELALLRRMLSSGTRVAIHGLGGVGKTQLAVKYADRHRADYPDGVFWLRAHEEMSLVSDLASLAWRLELPEREERKREYQVEAVLRWMRRHERWLLVLDNLMPNAAPSAGRWLPSDLPGHLLLTSRMPGWSDRVELVPWPQETARTFLLTRTRQTDTTAADAIAELLGCLPLALEQAAAYMEASGRNLAGYAALLRARLADLMDEGKPDEYPQPVSRTWQITLLRIAAERPATLALLRFCSFLAPDDIPVSVIQASAGELPHEMRDMVADDIELDRAIASLRRYSLLERQDDGLRVHRLVQAMSRRSMTAEQRVEFLTSAIRMLWATLSDTPREHPRRWSLYSRLLSHVDAVDQLATSTQTGLHELAQLLGRVGQYHAARSDFTHARQLHEREVSINERVRGRAHLETAASIHRLGRAMLNLGNLDAAASLMERALVIRQESLGQDHPDTIASIDDIAVILAERGDLATSIGHLRRVVAVKSRLLGGEHRSTLITIENMGWLLRQIGQLAEAQSLLEPALATRERVYGSDSVETAYTLLNLGMVLREQGELARARSLVERSLTIRLEAFGPDHHRTIQSRQRLAEVMLDQGEREAAKEQLVLALEASTRLLGSDHRLTKAIDVSLGALASP